jgi:hypothetical protein
MPRSAALQRRVLASAYSKALRADLLRCTRVVANAETRITQVRDSLIFDRKHRRTTPKVCGCGKKF